MTHKNHWDQEVGVDHIFIRPINCHSQNNTASSMTQTTTTASVFHVRDDINDSQNSSSHDSEMTISSGNSTNSSLINSSRSSNASYRLFVNTSLVLPIHMSCQYWSSDFQISDHRPVKTNIIIMNELRLSS